MGHHMVPSGYSGLQQVTACNRVVTVGYSRLQEVTLGYSRLQQVTERLQWDTAGYRVVTVGHHMVPSG